MALVLVAVSLSDGVVEMSLIFCLVFSKQQFHRNEKVEFEPLVSIHGRLDWMAYLAVVAVFGLLNEYFSARKQF
jgi:hypothetical protein